ncbi:TolC family protein [soil metagenome]
MLRYFNKFGLISYLCFLILISVSAFSASAQETAPTATATPEIVVNEEVEIPHVDDKQEVQPENLKGVPVIAPNYESEDRTLPDLGRVGVDMMQQLPISIKEAIVRALDNNKDIEVTRQNVRIAEFDFQAADGAFEPGFTGQTLYERATVPNVSIFSTNQTTTNESIVGNIRYSGSLRRFGTNYYAEINNTRLGTNNPISILSPQYNTNFNFGISQPLFKGRNFDQRRRSIEITRRNLSLTDLQFRQNTIEIIANVQRAYWDLTFALRNLQVQRDGVKDAKQQLAHNRRLVEEGQLAPIDIVAAETQVANLQLAVYDALETVNRAENNLKNLIAENRTDKIWTKSIVPTSNVELDAPNTTLPEALELALQNRPEIEQNKVAEDINKIDQNFFRDQTKPQIDLTASYTSAGVGGSQNSSFSSPFPSPCQTNPASPACQQFTNNINGLVGSPITDIFANRYPTFRVGVTFSFNLDGKTQKAQLGRSLVEGERIETQREQLEQVIQVDVRNALQSVRTAEARLRTAAIARANSERQYESEQRKLDAGQSDIYKVLERQTALVNARSAELRAQTELNKAIAELQRATGNSLKDNDVEARLRK